MNRARLLLLALLGASLATGCSEADAPETTDRGDTGERLRVFVVNHPLEYFAARIGADHVEVHLPVPEGVDPAFWSPDAETVAAYQAADLVLENGAGYARWIGRASLHRAKRVDTAAGFRDRFIQRPEAVTHGHGPTGEHSHRGTAFTTWLDPTLAVEQARVITESFASRRPVKRAEFARNLSALEADLVALDRRLEAATAALRRAPVLFSHPVYAYFARRYEIDGRSLDWEPDVFPEPRAWRALEAMLAEQPARLLIFEDPPLEETQRRLEDLGIRTVVVDPGGNRTAKKAWLEVMQANARRLEELAHPVPGAEAP